MIYEVYWINLYQLTKFFLQNYNEGSRIRKTFYSLIKCSSPIFQPVSRGKNPPQSTLIRDFPWTTNRRLPTQGHTKWKLQLVYKLVNVERAIKLQISHNEILDPKSHIYRFKQVGSRYVAMTCTIKIDHCDALYWYHYTFTTNWHQTQSLAYNLMVTCSCMEPFGW